VKKKKKRRKRLRGAGGSLTIPVYEPSKTKRGKGVKRREKTHSLLIFQEKGRKEKGGKTKSWSLQRIRKKGKEKNGQKKKRTRPYGSRLSTHIVNGRKEGGKSAIQSGFRESLD